MTARILVRLQRDLADDRARERKSRNRVVLAEYRLIEALEDWQLEAGEPDRTEARRWAQRRARELRKERSRLCAVKRMTRFTEVQFQAARAATMMMEIG